MHHWCINSFPQKDCALDMQCQVCPACYYYYHVSYLKTHNNPNAISYSNTKILSWPIPSFLYFYSLLEQFKKEISILMCLWYTEEWRHLNWQRSTLKFHTRLRLWGTWHQSDSLVAFFSRVYQWSTWGIKTSPHFAISLS